MQRGDVVLHLHGFENEEDVALLHGLSGFDIDFLDHARDRSGNGLTAFNKGLSRGGSGSCAFCADGEFGPVNGDHHRISFRIRNLYGKSFSVYCY